MRPIFNVMLIVILFHLFSCTSNRLHLAYTWDTRDKYDSYRYRLTAMIQNHLLEEYGSDWIYEHMVKTTQPQFFSFYFSNTGTMIISTTVNVYDEPEYIHGIKQFFDSLAYNNEIIVVELLSSPFEVIEGKISLREQAHAIMRYYAYRFFWRYRDWDYACLFMGDERYDKSKQVELYGIYNIFLNEFMTNEFFEKYVYKCDTLGCNPVVSKYACTEEYTDDEKALFFEYVNVSNESVLSLKQDKDDLYQVPFAYTPDNTGKVFSVIKKQEM